MSRDDYQSIVGLVFDGSIKDWSEVASRWEQEIVVPDSLTPSESETR